MLKIAYILILLFCCGELSAQKYPFTRFSVYEGLSQSQITALALDEQGSVIIGTKTGLSIFDGIEVKMMEDSVLMRGWISHQVTSIYPFGKYFYVCMGANMVAKYNITSGKVEKYWEKTDGQNKLRPITLVIDENGQVLLTNQERMIYKFEETTQQLIKYDSLTHPQIAGITQWKFDKESNNIIILDSKGKIWNYKNKKLSLIPTSADFQMLYQQSPQTPIYSLAKQEVYKLEQGLFRHLYDIPETISAVFDVCFAVDSAENSYYKIYHPEKRSFEIKKYDKKRAISLTTSFFNTAINPWLLIKDENHLCIPTENGFYYNPSQAFTLYDESTLGILPNIWSIMEDKKGNLKLASFGYGMMTLNPLTQKITQDERYIPLLGLDKRKNINFYMGGIRTKNGDCYFLLEGSGAVKYDGIKYDTLSYQANIEKATIFMSMYEDTDKIYFGERKKIFIYNKINKKITHILPIALKGKTLGSFVTDIEKDKNGNLWIGGRRLAIWDMISDSIQTLYEKGKEYPLNGSFTIQKDYQQNLWIGGSDGLVLYDYQGFKQIAKGRLKNIISSMIDIDSSYLVLGGIEGMYLLDLQRFYKNKETWLYFFEKNNGYLIEESGQNAFYKEVSGENIWLPGLRGVAKMNVAELKRQIKDAYLETGILKVGKGEKEYDFTQKFHLYADENENLSLLLKNERHQIVYAYSIEYEGGTKIEQTTRDTILSIPLRQGRCKITVKVKLATGFTQGGNFVIEFQVKPYFWKTAWGTFLIIALIIGISIGIIGQYYRYQQKKEQLQAEIQIAQERTEKQIHAFAKKDAELKSVTAQLNTHLFTLERHFILNYLNNVVLWAIMEGTKEVAKDAIIKFGKFLRRIVLDNNQSFWEIEKELTFVEDYVQLENMRWGDKIHCLIEISPEIDKNRIIPKGIIQNYVSNAIKHGYSLAKENAHIWVRIYKQVSTLTIEIDDDGVGIDLTQKQNDSEKDNGKQSTYRGIALIASVLDHLNELNEIQSTQIFQNKATISPHTKGTIVTISLPYQLITQHKTSDGK